MSSSDPSFFAADGPPPPPESLPPMADEPLDVLPADPDEAPPGPPTPPVPPRPPHPNFWWALLWAVGFLVLITGAQIGFLIVAVVIRLVIARGAPPVLVDPATGKLGPGMAQLFAPALFGAEALAVAAALLVARLVVGIDWRRRLAVGRPGVAHVLLALLGVPGMLLFPSLVAEYAARVLPTFNNAQANMDLFTQWPVWFAVLVVGLGPGVAEELFCRGFLGRGLVGHYGVVAGVLLTSLLFGMLHMDPPQVVGTAVLGLWLHYVYLMSRSLPLSMFLHFFNNATAITMGWYLHESGAKPEDAPAYIYVAAAVLTGAVAWAFYDGRARLAAVKPGAAAWHPDFPGVQLPPPGTDTRVARPWPRWWCLLAVLAGIAAFAGAYAFAVVHGEPGI